MTQTPDSISTVKDNLKGMMKEFNLERCDIYGFYALCNPINPKAVPEKILIALNKEWGEEKMRLYAGQFGWVNITEEILEVHTSVI